MLKKIFILFVLFTFATNAQKNDTDFAVYNILSGTVIGGAGALINKNPEEKFWRALWRGSSQGAIGGYLNFESKRLIRNFTTKNDYVYIWPSRLLNAAGNSIIMNAASNKKFGQSWHFNLAFIHLKYSLIDDKKFKIRMMPFSLTSAVHSFFNGKLDFDKSLKAGLLIFETETIFNNYLGYTQVNTIFYSKDLDQESLFNTIGHEIIHAYQYNGTMPINSLLNKTVKRLTNTDNRYLNFYDKVFYTDFNYLINMSVHGVEDLLNTPLRKRIKEIEPFYFGERVQF